MTQSKNGPKKLVLMNTSKCYLSTEEDKGMADPYECNIVS